MGLGADIDFGLVPVGNAGLRLFHRNRGMAQKALGLAHLHGVAVKHHLARQFGQRRPGLFAGAQQVVRHELIRHIVHLGVDLKLALAGLFKRHMVQLALDAKAHRAGLTRGNRFAHIVQRLAAQVLRQIAVNARTVGAAELPLQVQHAGEFGLRLGARPRLPAGVGLPGRVFIGKAQLGHLHLDDRPFGIAFVQYLPAHLGFKLGQRNVRVFKDAGKAQHGVGDIGGFDQRGLAALLVQREITAQAMPAGLADVFGALFRWLGTQRQLLHLARCLVLHRLLQRAAP